MGVFFDQLNAVFVRYKVVVWLVLGAAIAFGFDFKTPAHHFRTIEGSLRELRSTDTVLSHRIASGDSSREQMAFYLRALMVAQCLDRPARQTLLMGLPCAELLNPRPAPVRFP